VRSKPKLRDFILKISHPNCARSKNGISNVLSISDCTAVLNVTVTLDTAWFLCP